MSAGRGSWRARQATLLPAAALLLAGTALQEACTQFNPAFDSTSFVRGQIAQQAGPQVASEVEVPFAIDDTVRLAFRRFSRLGSSDDERTAELLDFIFHQLALTYEQVPTRDALSTFRTHRGNCLSFVNLFVGLGRDIRLNPNYVEVTDYQRWNHREGMVISQGHIVAGMTLDGAFKTFDFIPYQEKAYRNFHPIDDLTAVAHFYNNLGAEALMTGNLAEARRLVTLATRIAPKFPNALNNLGVCMVRAGDLAGGLEKYQAALANSPGNSMVLTNIMHVYQEQGRVKEADEIEQQVESSNTSNPFFFLYLGETALARGDTAKALEHMVHALRLSSDLAEVQLGLVKVYLAQGDLEKARHFLKRALELDATDKEAQKYARLLGAS
jgi:tetratricopeptide (TPR) repeat protein